MTTKDSPVGALRAQAEKIAATLKGVERGDVGVPDPGGKLAASLAKGEVSFAVIMDDKVLKITMPWRTVRLSSTAGLIVYILGKMREERLHA